MEIRCEDYLLVSYNFPFTTLFTRAVAMVAYEDTYLTILDVDGPEYTDMLRKRMWDPAIKVVFPSEQRWLLSDAS